MMTELYYDTESENIYTKEELEEFRQIAIEDGDTLATETLENFIKYSLAENNGTLVPIKKIRSTYYKGIEIVSIWNIKSDLY